MNIDKISSWFKFLVSKFGWQGLKGLYAEKLVLAQLRLHLPNDAIILENVTIQYQTYTTQIDFIVLLPTGIYVIEVKNYKGYITATAKYNKWFVKYRNHPNARSYHIYSPLHQNEAHCNALSLLLNLPISDIYNVVAFTGRANVRIANGEYLPNVCTGKELIHFLNESRPVMYSNDDLQRISMNISRNRLVPDLQTDYFHVQLIKQKFKDRQDYIEERQREKIRKAQEYAHREYSKEKDNAE